VSAFVDVSSRPIPPAFEQLDNGRWYAHWFLDTDRICVGEHAEAKFELDGDPSSGLSTAEVTVIGHANVPLSQPYSAVLTGSGGQWRGTVKDIGLRHVYRDDEPGAVLSEIELSFPSRGSQAADHALVLAYVSRVKITLNYAQFVDPSP
jgi:hypothetical protein